jgi:hypothetical protein
VNNRQKKLASKRRQDAELLTVSHFKCAAIAGADVWHSADVIETISQMNLSYQFENMHDSVRIVRSEMGSNTIYLRDPRCR